MIKTIATDFEAGQIFEGTVVSIKEFGAFVEFAPGKEGMVHISKISDHRINRVEDVLTLGDKVKVICLGKDKMGRMSFSIKDVPERRRASGRSVGCRLQSLLSGLSEPDYLGSKWWTCIYRSGGNRDIYRAG